MAAEEDRSVRQLPNIWALKCYDKELLEHAANDSGICKELFEHHDEKPTNSFLYSLVMVITILLVILLRDSTICP